MLFLFDMEYWGAEVKYGLWPIRKRDETLKKV